MSKDNLYKELKDEGVEKLPLDELDKVAGGYIVKEVEQPGSQVFICGSWTPKNQAEVNTVICDTCLHWDRYECKLGYMVTIHKNEETTLKYE